MTSNMTMIDRISQRLLSDTSGSLISEEDMYEMVKQAISKTFLDPRPNPDTGWNSPKMLPSRLEGLMISHFEEKIHKVGKDIISKWVEENSDEFEKMIKEAMIQTPEIIIRRIIYSFFETAFSSYKASLDQLKIDIAGSISNSMMR